MNRWLRNWELKIIAVLLAAFLWFALRLNPGGPLPPAIDPVPAAR